MMIALDNILIYILNYALVNSMKLIEFNLGLPFYNYINKLHNLLTITKISSFPYYYFHKVVTTLERTYK